MYVCVPEDGTHSYETIEDGYNLGPLGDGEPIGCDIGLRIKYEWSTDSQESLTYEYPVESNYFYKTQQ